MKVVLEGGGDEPLVLHAKRDVHTERDVHAKRERHTHAKNEL